MRSRHLRSPRDGELMWNSWSWASDADEAEDGQEGQREHRREVAVFIANKTFQRFDVHVGASR
jgi:hypothetical protein